MGQIIRRHREIWLSACLGLCALACSNTAALTPAKPDSLSDVSYEGIATDEALVDLTAAVRIEGKAPKFTQPSPNQAFTSTSAPAFSWSEPTAHRIPARRPVRFQLGRLLEFEGTAHAHGAATTGLAYFVVFATAKDPKLLRVFTSKTSYAPAADALERLKAAKAPISVTVTAATFADNRILPGSGPYASQPVTFTVAP
jgi:hypothetical protein